LDCGGYTTIIKPVVLNGCETGAITGRLKLSLKTSGFGGLEVACCPLLPKFAGSHPAEAAGFLVEKILSTPSFGGEVKAVSPMS